MERAMGSNTGHGQIVAEAKKQKEKRFSTPLLKKKLPTHSFDPGL
jgi:hypothetical protein